jgi:alpha-galactosidase/6-phospho-beta-glucosidase family protein
VDVRVRDRATGVEVNARSEFIEGLHHRSWIIQVSKLKSRRRDDFERLLSIFDQANAGEDKHVLNLEEEDFPEMYRSIIRRLRRAADTPEVRDQMDMEDEYIEPYRALERANKESKQIIEDKDLLLEEKDREDAENKRLIEEKDREIEALKRLLGKG